MRSRRSNPVRPIAAAETLDPAFQKLHMPLVRVVQVGALVVSVVTFGMALASLPTAGALAFSSDGQKLVGTVNGYGWPMPRGMIKVWDAAMGKEFASLAGSGPRVRAIAVSPDGSTLAVAHDSPVIELWDLRQGTRTGFLAGHKANAMAVRFSPVGAILISASEDGEVRLWDVAKRRTQLSFDIGDHGLPGLMVSQDGKTLVTYHIGDIRFWDLADGHLAKEIQRDRVGFLGFSGSGHVCLLTRITGRHGSIGSVLDGATQAARFALRPTSRLLLLSPDRQSIAVEQWSPTMSILDAATGRELVRAKGLEDAAHCLAFSPDGKTLAAGDDNGRVCIWDAGSGRLRASLYCGDRLRRWGPLAAGCSFG